MHTQTITIRYMYMCVYLSIYGGSRCETKVRTLKGIRHYCCSVCVCVCVWDPFTGCQDRIPCTLRGLQHATSCCQATLILLLILLMIRNWF